MMREGSTIAVRDLLERLPLQKAVNFRLPQRVRWSLASAFFVMRSEMS